MTFENYRKIHSNPFYQQKLAAWTPSFRTNQAAPLFAAASIFFIILSVLTFAANRNLSEYTLDYTNCADQEQKPCRNSTGTCKCIVTMKIDSDIKGPVYLYYNINGMNLNYRSFLSSMEPKQFTGADIPLSSLNQCDPYNEINGVPILPCGAYPRAIFNDTFIMKKDGKNLVLSQKNIAWDTDVSRKFGHLTPTVANKTVKPPNWSKSIMERSSDPFKSDESFMVWMRPSISSNFIKLYAIIQTENNILQKGDYEFQIDYNFPVHPFNGKKSILIANAGIIGGKNLVYPIVLSIGAVIYAILSIFMYLIVAGKIKRRKRDSDQIHSEMTFPPRFNQGHDVDPISKQHLISPEHSTSI